MKYVDTIKKRIIKYIYTVSKQPVLFKDLLRANLLYNEGMYVDPGILNFRKNINKAYVAYGLICAAILLPALIITHKIFANIDFHISILGTIFVTSSVFIGFTFFNAWVRDGITHGLIKEAWRLHFPYFPYEKYSKKVEEIYQNALKEEIPKKDFEQYVLGKIIENKKENG